MKHKFIEDYADDADIIFEGSMADAIEALAMLGLTGKKDWRIAQQPCMIKEAFGPCELRQILGQYQWDEVRLLYDKGIGGLYIRGFGLSLWLFRITKTFLAMEKLGALSNRQRVYPEAMFVRPTKISHKKLSTLKSLVALGAFKELSSEDE